MPRSDSESSKVELRARQLEEQDFIRKNDTAKASVWYLIDVRWLQEWRKFVTRGSAIPGPIDNSRLLDDVTQQPKDGIQAVKDFRGVNAIVWEFLHRRYGGGPTLRCRGLDLANYRPASVECGSVRRPMPSRSPPSPTGTDSPVSPPSFNGSFMPPPREATSEDSPIPAQEAQVRRPGGTADAAKLERGPMPDCRSLGPGQLVFAEYDGQSWYLARVVRAGRGTCDVAWLRPCAEQWGSSMAMRQYLCSTGADETLHCRNLPVSSCIRLALPTGST